MLFWDGGGFEEVDAFDPERTDGSDAAYWDGAFSPRYDGGEVSVPVDFVPGERGYASNADLKGPLWSVVVDGIPRDRFALVTMRDGMAACRWAGVRRGIARLFRQARQSEHGSAVVRVNGRTVVVEWDE